MIDGIIFEKPKSDGIRLSEVKYCGFTPEELAQVQRYIVRHDLEYLDPVFIQDVTDMVGYDTGTMFLPNGPVVMVKLGGQYNG